MATRPTFTSLTPLVAAGDSLDEALRIYVERLGFALEWRGESMAGIRRGDVELHLVLSSNLEWARNTSFSIGVRGLELLFEEYRGCGLEVGPLEDKPWGRREFHMIVPPGVCLQFHEAEPAFRAEVP